MKPPITVTGLLLLSVLFVSCSPRPMKQPSAFILRSEAFAQNGLIPQQYSCDAEGMSPPLSVAGVPENAKSLALIMDDPDAKPATFVHWVIWNLLPQDQTIPQGVVIDSSKLGKTSAGGVAYVPPCPPRGTHTYHFKLYALDRTLAFDAPPTSEQLQKAMEGHILGRTELAATYSRS